MTGYITPQRSGSTRASRIGGPEAWVVWALATTFVVWLFAIQTGYAVVSPEIQESAGLTLAQIGLAASIYTWVFALVQVFSGALLDRFGSRPLLGVAAALVTVGAFLYAGTTSFAALALAQTVLALGASFGFVGAGYIGGKWFAAARYGLMFGLVQAAASLGSAVALPAIQLLLHSITWQQLLLAFGSFGVILTLVFFAIVRDPILRGEPHEAPRGNVLAGIFRGLGRCFASPNVVLASIFGGAAFGTMLAVGTLWGPRIMQARGASADFATLLTALAWLGLALGAPLVNVVSDRWRSRRAPAMVCLALEAVAITLVIYLPAQTNGAAMTLMFAVGLFSGVQMLGFTVAGESVPPTLIGSAAAIVNGVCFLIGGLLTAIPSSLMPADPSLDDYRATLWLMPAVLIVGLIAAAMLRRPLTPRDIPGRRSRRTNAPVPLDRP